MDPYDLFLINLIGASYNGLHRPYDAIEYFGRAIDIDPSFYKAHLNIANSLGDIGRAEEAIDHYGKVIELEPDLAKAYTNLATLYISLGERDRAYEILAMQIDRGSKSVETYSILSRIHRYQKNDPLIEQMESLLEEITSSDDRADLLFALSKAYRDIGSHSRSFDLLQQANRLQASSREFDIDDYIERFATIKRLFESDLEPLPTVESHREPIFIVGMPRSGTTLVEQIISSHSSVYGAGELTYMGDIADEILKQKSLTQESIRYIRDEYMRRVGEIGFDEAIFTDKMPQNFESIGFILSALPNAKIVHLERDPMAVCWSMYQLNFPSEGLGYSNDLDSLAHFYHMHEDMMAFWRAKYPDRIYDISYERHTTPQEEESRGLLEYCGLEWED
jgi:tetratricopeptide (TPR) repeat protein